MRRLTIVGSTGAVVAALVAVVALAQDAPVQTTFTVEARVVPNRAGTPSEPQGHKIFASARFFTPDGYERPILTHGHVLFPRAGDYNGHLFPKCSKRTLTREGPEGCPRRSKIGAGRGSAYADTIVTYPRIEGFNAGRKLAYAYVTLYRPALVREPVPVHIRELPSGRWKYKVSFKVPEPLQIVAGIPIAARTLKGWVGRENLITSTLCPRNRRWSYELVGHFDSGLPYTYRDSVPCRPARR